MTEDAHMETVMNSILSYISPEVNAIEAASIYMDENHIDPDTFAEFIRKQPKLWSMVYDSAIHTNVVKLQHGRLTF